MHEFSIASDIVQSAREACDSEAGQLRQLHIQVGQLSSVVIPSLEMCLEAVLEEEGLDDVEVEIDEVPARAQCECGHTYEPASLFDECPKCGGFEREITDGRQVILDSIEVDDGENQSQ